MSIRIRVPATTANLGPGFDCLGLALDIWNEVEVEETGDHPDIRIDGEGADRLPADDQNAIYSAMKFYALQHNRFLPAGLRIQCLNRIPLGSGMGSSAAAAVAGIMCASACLNTPYDVVDMLEIAAKIEGHPDNAAPCLMGGLVASITDPDCIIARPIPVAPLFLCITLPDFNLPTRQARAVLPAQVSRENAVFNLGRAVMTVEALRSGDLDLLSIAMQDQIHQNYRMKLIPGAADALSAARFAGAAAVALSGAGPSLLAVARDQHDLPEISRAMEAAFNKAGLPARSFFPHITPVGAQMIPD
jgi:homoserine kinase